MLALVLRLAVTAGAIALPTLLGRVPLPGVDVDVIEVAPHVSLGALGLDAILFTFVAVELAALAVPRWRPLRRGRGRAHLARWIVVAGAVLVVAQAAFVACSLRATSWGVFAEGLGAWALDVVALVGGVLAMLGAAFAVRRHGVGHGLSVVVVLGALPGWLERLSLATSDAVDPEAPVRLLLVALVATVLVVGREVRGERVPIVGLVPLFVVPWLMQVVALVSVLLWLPLEALYAASFTTVAGVVVALGALGVWLAAKDRGLAAWRARAPAVALSLALPVVVLAGDRALGLEVGLPATGVGLAFFVVAVIVAQDVLREASVRLREPLVPVIAFDDVDVAARVGQSLVAADVPHVMRGIGHRTLLRIFGPWVPVTLLVSEARRGEAMRVAELEANREAYAEIARIF